jgi:hypothetical protein
MGPVLSLLAGIGSGDREGNTMRTVSPPHPRAGPFGNIRLIRGYSNMLLARPAVHWKPGGNLYLDLFWSVYGRQSEEDDIYVSPGSPLRSLDSTPGRYIGQQPRVRIGWTPSRYIRAEAEYIYFISGEVIRRSGPTPRWCATSAGARCRCRVPSPTTASSCAAASTIRWWTSQPATPCGPASGSDALVTSRSSIAARVTLASPGDVPRPTSTGSDLGRMGRRRSTRKAKKGLCADE